MKMHEFLSSHRDELYEVCVDHLKRNAPERERAELGDHLRPFIDGVIRTLRLAEGLGSLGANAAAGGPEHLGHVRHGRGFRIEQVAQTYATLSVSVGDVGGAHGVSFTAREYGVFNEAIDMSVAAAIEQFSKDDRECHDREASARLGFLAHELRNSLSSARMASAMIERGQVAVGGSTAAVLRRALARMNRMIDQTLAAARLSSAAPLRFRTLPVRALLEETEASSVLERQITFALECDDSLTVVGDEDLLLSAIGNLAQNAIKFSVIHSVITLRASTQGEDVVIAVEDACGGLPAGDGARLFEPFVQATTDRRGVGLGLAITRDAVSAMGGSLSLRDRPGQGCVFEIRLPRRASDDALGAEAAPASSVS